MPSTLLNTLVFSALLLLARARPQDSRQTGGYTIGMVNDWVPSGNYLIYSCGSQATDVKNILDMTYLLLQTAILSTESSAYKAFFRSAAPDSMTAVLKGITAGTNITTVSHGSRRPHLVCVNAVDAGIRTFWNLCQESEQTVVIQPPATSIVFLCPIFFDIKPLPQSTDCGTVNHASTALISSSHIAATQYGFLVQPLAEMYIRQIMRTSGQVGSENACLALPPDQALRNPSSYAFYVSNVRAGCTQFPSKVAIQRDRELLAVDGAGGGNGSDILTMGCISKGTNSSSCSL